MGTQGGTLAAMLLDRIARTPGLPAMRWKQDGVWQMLTWEQAGARAREVAAGMLALGVERGETVNILSANRPEWHLADWGTMLAGALPVPIYTTNSPEQVAYVADHSGAKVAVVEDADQLRKIVKVLDQLPQLQRIVLMSGRPDEVDERIMSWPELLAAGRAYAEQHPSAVDERARSLTPEDLATIVYTSGTTGPPKGSMLTHANATWTLRSVDQVVRLRDGLERTVSYLPLAHIFERLVSDWASVYYGTDVWFAESIDKLGENLREIRPTYMIGVPRVYEKFHQRILASIREHPKRALIERAVGVGRELVDRREAGAGVPALLRARAMLLDRLVLRKLRHQAGLDQARFLVTGAAPINPEIIRFIRSLGVNLIEGYGQTEVCAPTAMTPPERPRIGSVGPPIPGLEVRIEDDGEILVRGGNVFAGYYKDDEATRAAFTEDGFLRTGDVGRFDEAGYLQITDRKKDLIITAGGKNIAPQVIEEQLKFSPLVSQAVVIGDQRPYVSALLAPDPEGVAAWAAEHGKEGVAFETLVHDEELLADVGRAVDGVNAKLSNVEQVKRWTLLDHELTQEANEITPTIKVRRMVIKQRYEDEIEQLYQR